MEISITPIVTEAATNLTEKLNRYTFRVSPDANKYQIKDLVEKLYGVKVTSVNTQVVRGKNKSRYTKSGLLRGKTASWKKARPSTSTATSKTSLRARHPPRAPGDGEAQADKCRPAPRQAPREPKLRGR